MRTIQITSVLLAAALMPACGGGSSAEPELAAETSEGADPGPLATNESPVTSPSTSVLTPPASTALDPGEEWFAYQEAVDQIAQIFLVRPDGSGRRQLAPGVATGDQTNPDWSPEGDRLVFAAGNGSTDDLWTINADGSDPALLLECVEPCVALDDPAWSPDGSAILFSRLGIAASGEVATGSLESIDLASGEVTKLLTAPEPDFIAGQRFSPDGRMVVLEWVHTDGSGPFEGVTGVELAVIDLTETSPTMQPITDPATFAATADWSPDGSTIVFSALRSPDGVAPELFSVHPDGTRLTQLTSLVEDGGSAEHPDYLRDGGVVVFAGTVDGEERVLMEVDVQTGNVRPAVGIEYAIGAHPRSRLVG